MPDAVPIETILRVAIPVLAAVIAGRFAGRLVKLMVRRVGNRRARHGPGVIRRHTPSVLLDSGELFNARSLQRTEALAAVLASVVTVIVWIAAAILVVHALGVRLGPLLTGAGLLGVALAFAMQPLIRDVLSGVLILVEDQFGVGDWVDLGRASGSVEAVTLRATRIRGIDGTVWHVPNGRIERVGNMSQHWARAIVDIRIAYRSDVDRARTAIERAADEVWRGEGSMIERPEMWGVESLGPAGVTLRLAAKTRPLEQWRIGRVLRERITAELEREGVEVPPAAIIATPEGSPAQGPSAPGPG